MSQTAALSEFTARNYTLQAAVQTAMYFCEEGFLPAKSYMKYVCGVVAFRERGRVTEGNCVCVCGGGGGPFNTLCSSS